jgi:hypothetical protein
MKVYVIGSAAIPTIILAMLLIATVQTSRSKARRRLTTSRGTPARSSGRLPPVERASPTTMGIVTGALSKKQNSGSPDRTHSGAVSLWGRPTASI